MCLHHAQMLLDTPVELAKDACGSFRTREGMRDVVRVGCFAVLIEFARALEPFQRWTVTTLRDVLANVCNILIV